MANKKYQDQNGVLFLLQLLKGIFDTKVDKVDGKGLSTNDYTTAEKNKLSNIEAQANRTTINNTLESEATDQALSAAQGKALKARIEEVNNAIGQAGGGDMMKADYDTDMDGVIDDSAKLGGHEPSYFAAASALDNYLATNGNGSNVTATFTAAGSRGNIASGESLSVLFGKIARFFTDLKAVAFSGSYTDLTNKPTIPTVSNDLTDALKANYDAAYTFSQGTHAPADAQKNIIEGVQVNGSTVAPTNKIVNISVPAHVSDLDDAGNYALKSDITNVYKYKGSVASFSALPASGNTTGDVYNVEDTDMNYAWNGTKWDPLGELFTIETLTNEEIDAMFTEVFGS